MDNTELLNILESELTEHRAFGDSAYIREQMETCFERRLSKIGARQPVAGHLLDALSRADSYTRYRVLGDSVVRCTIQHALSQLETGNAYGLPLDDCAEVFQATIRHLKDGKSGGPLESGAAPVNRLGSEPYHGWIWSEEHSDDIFGRSFRYIVESNYGQSLYSPTAGEVEMLARGTRLLEDLLPALSQSALYHAHLIAVFPSAGNWRGRSSASQYRITGTFFLSRGGLEDPWYVAEHVFHEALHQKLYDFRHGHTLLDPSFERPDGPRICSLWNEPSKSHNWDIHRAIAAFHVYVHLGLLCTIAEHRAPELESVYGPLQGMVGSRKSLDRARYLGEQIKETGWQELGLAGQYLVDWLISVEDALDASPPPHGAYVHLLLDRYGREARKVEIALRKPSHEGVRGGANTIILQRELMRLLKEEVKSVECALSAVGADDDLIRFGKAIAQYPDEELGARFFEVRGLISKTLLTLSRNGDGYRSNPSPLESGSAGAILKQMVEGSSHRLDKILAE